MSRIQVRLHHVGILVNDVATAAAAYMGRFGYEARTGIIHDPVQTAFVQFLQLPDESSFLELVAPDGPQSKLANALSKGGGTNHVCYATNQIEQLCDRLRGQGMFLIQPPVPAVAFQGRRIAWLTGRDRALTELAEEGPVGQL
jgi:methylmalonyl-CoA/ethylmalonyl-CoA epimerase